MGSATGHLYSIREQSAVNILNLQIYSHLVVVPIAFAYILVKKGMVEARNELNQLSGAHNGKERPTSITIMLRVQHITLLIRMHLRSVYVRLRLMSCK